MLSVSQSIWKAFFRVPDLSSDLRIASLTHCALLILELIYLLVLGMEGQNRATAAGLSCTPGDLWPLELKGEIMTTQSYPI